MNPVVVERLLEHRPRQHEIPYQLAASGKAQPQRRNAHADQPGRRRDRPGRAFPTATCTAPVEMISLDDIDRAADLLAEFVLSLNGDEDFTP